MIGMYPYCVYRKVTCSCHVSEIFDLFVKDGKKCVCAYMMYACRKCSESNMAGFIVCLLMKYKCRKCSESNMTGFLVGILCTSMYRCIFLCSVVKRGGVTRGGIF